MNEIAPIHDANALIVLPEKDADVMALFTGEYDITIAPLLKHIERAVENFRNMNPDPRTEDGRKAISKFDYKLARSRTALDNAGKNVVTVLKELPKKIDANRKLARDLIEGWQGEITAPVKAWEKAEDDRKKVHVDAIEAIVSLGGMTEIHAVVDIRNAIARVASVPVDSPLCEEFQSEYAIARTNALGRLMAALEAREKFDADQIELAALRQAQAQRDAKDAEERAVAAERERFARDRQTVIDLIRLDANVEFLAAAGIRQRLAKLTDNDLLPTSWGDFLGEARRAVDETLLSLRASLAEAERKEAEQDIARHEAAAKFLAAEEETRRVEAERQREAAERRRLQEEADKREADARIAAAKQKAHLEAERERADNLDHRKRCNNEARDALALLMPGGAKGNIEVATAVLSEIIRGKIPHISITY